MEEENTNDDLDEIFVKKNIPLDRRILVSILKPFVTIDEEGNIDFKEEYEELSSWRKIIVFLCCKKAMFVRNLAEEEGASPKEISEGAHISVSAAKKIAVEKKIFRLVKNEKGRYVIPNFNLRKCEETLKDGKNR